MLRAAGGTPPPPAIGGQWPRDLTKSVALYGEAAIHIKTHQTFQALSGPKLVTRTIDLATSAFKISDTPKSMALETHVENSKSFPEGSLQVASADEPKSQRTWNARVRVRQ